MISYFLRPQQTTCTRSVVKKTKYTIYSAKFARYTLSSNKCHAHVQKCINLPK